MWFHDFLLFLLVSEKARYLWLWLTLEIFHWFVNKMLFMTFFNSLKRIIEFTIIKSNWFVHFIYFDSDSPITLIYVTITIISDLFLSLRHPVDSIISLAPSSEFVSSSIPSWQILTAHAQPFRGARDLAFCLKVPLDSLLVWASSEGSGETARMRRVAWTFAARIGDNYQIRLTRSSLSEDDSFFHKKNADRAPIIMIRLNSKFEELYHPRLDRYTQLA